MSAILKIVTIVAQLCPFTLAADCNSHPALCRAGYDETSLMQMKKSLAIGTEKQPGNTVTQTVVTQTVTQTTDDGAGADASGNFSIDNASAPYIIDGLQDDLKAAQSNTSIQMYAHSVAKLNYAKTLWAAAKAASKAEGATLKEVKAERAAAMAVQALQDEVDAWKAAVSAQGDADMSAEIAEADASAKHIAMMNASATAAAAKAAHASAESDASEVEIVQQQLVNDAAAEAAAVFAHDAKVQAAAAAAAKRAAQAVADAKNADADAARKAAWHSLNHAWTNEWHAHHKSWSAQQAARAAAGAAVTGDLAAAVANISAALNLTALIQQEPDDLVSENDTELDIIAANASIAVDAAETFVSQAASDEKKAKAAEEVAEYAADSAEAKLKVKEHKADVSYTKAMAATASAAKLAREAREAEEAVKVAEWKHKHASVADMVANITANLSENATYNTAAAVRTAKDIESYAESAVKTLTDAAMREKVIDAYVTADADATDAADEASASRIISDYGEFEKANAEMATENATDYAKAAHENYIAELKNSNTAESRATHTANQAQKWDAKMAAATFDKSVNTSSPTSSSSYTVEKTVHVSDTTLS